MSSLNAIMPRRPPPAQSAPAKPGKPIATMPSVEGMRNIPSLREAAKADTVGNHTLIKRGSRGRDVADLQERLRQAGYEPGEKGVYDEKTEAAVRQYQKDNGLKVDGIAGQQTWGHFVGETHPPGKEKLGTQPNYPAPGVGYEPVDSFEPGGPGEPNGHQTPSKPPSTDPGEIGSGRNPDSSTVGNSGDGVRYRTRPANSRVIDGFDAIA